MTVYFSSDPHYYHKNIIKYQRRPFLVPGETYEKYSISSVHLMNETMIANWNAKVTPEDTTYLLGDFCFTDAERARMIFDRLNGKKILIGGNHDNWKIRTRLPWVSVHDYLELNLEGVRVVLSHYAFLTWNKIGRGSIHLHGHSHGSIPSTSQRCDVGVDCFNYSPVSLKEIQAHMEKLPAHIPADYHGRPR